jgi:16S rRNA (uracil1498-N3)-methyltransferase
MALPYFYISFYDPGSPGLVLDEDNSRHIVQVLRMKTGEQLQLTDGKGALLTGEIIDDHKKKCRVAIRSVNNTPPPANPVSIAISPLKNASRFEWFLEKATEIGVSTLIPLLCERTERTTIRLDRLHNILVSAMLQSQQSWLPILTEPTPLPKLLQSAEAGNRFIAHCLDSPAATTSLAAALNGHGPGLPSSILIGPEGDFSPAEIKLALSADFKPVTLGLNRLRTETAGIVAATLLCIH